MEEKKKKSKLKWIIIVIVAIAIIAAVAGGGSDDSVHQVKTDSKDSKVTNDNSKKEEKETEAKTSFKVGETAEYKDVQVTLEKVSSLMRAKNLLFAFLKSKTIPTALSP